MHPHQYVARFTKVLCAAYERYREIPFIDMEHFIRRCQHFALVEIIHAQRFKHFRLDIMTDASFGHNWNGYNFHDFLNDGWVSHPCYAPAARISEGTRSSAITAVAPAASAIFACSAFMTSIMTPPFAFPPYLFYS